MKGWLVDELVNYRSGWLRGWSVEGLVIRLKGWLIEGLVGSKVGWSKAWLVEGLVG